MPKTEIHVYVDDRCMTITPYTPGEDDIDLDALVNEALRMSEEEQK